MDRRKWLLGGLPYVVSVLAGLLFLRIGLELDRDTGGLFTSISAAFFAIPLIYLFYQLTQNLSQKRLSKEAFDYAKMQIDRQMLSIINQLHKMVYPLESRGFSPTVVSKFLSLRQDDLRQILSSNAYMGFQVLKSWEVAEESLHEVLRNSFILKRLENSQVISIISVIKSLRCLEGVQRTEGLYARTEEEASSFKVVAGSELNSENIRFPNRYLLLKDLTDNRCVVADFGDFAPYDVDKLLRMFVVDQGFLEIYSGAIFDLLGDVSNWLQLTGGEFVVDPKVFRMRRRTTAGADWRQERQVR